MGTVLASNRQVTGLKLTATAKFLNRGKNTCLPQETQTSLGASGTL